MTTHHPTPRKQPADQGWNRGFTLSETIIVVFLVGIVTAIVVTSVHDSIERARMASCMMELRGIQAALWHDSDGGNRTIDPVTFWDTHYKGTKPGPFVLMVDPGSAGGSEPGLPGFGAGAERRHDASFVVVGRYSHWAPGQYVYIEGDQPPRLVTSADTDPGYGEQIDWEAGRQWGAYSGEGAALAPDVSWSGSQSNGTYKSPGASGGSGASSGQSGGAGSAGSTGSSTASGRNTTSRIGD
jgi:prepilin-type N-terminal cleavage/methylation domain-containing protein